MAQHGVGVRYRASVRTRIATGVAVVGCLIMTWAVLFPAVPAQATSSTLELPDDTSAIWIDLEQAGLRAEDVEMSYHLDSGRWEALVPVKTTFGLHAEVDLGEAADPHEVAVRVLARLQPSRNLNPDLAVTAVSSTGGILAETRERITPARTGAPDDEFVPDVPDDTSMPAAGSDEAADRGRPSGWLESTGLALLPAAIAATGFLCVGILLRRLRRTVSSDRASS
ncbi:hypothetical protein [Plantibacter flavus]|uniref:hypothetical protein n=1 Tax=Plantibacter flavus TaxID=150123 RepID=UPI00129473F4|nr:hypothetical protein [Plantibacter flavus]